MKKADQVAKALLTLLDASNDDVEAAIDAARTYLPVAVLRQLHRAWSHRLVDCRRCGNTFSSAVSDICTTCTR